MSAERRVSVEEVLLKLLRDPVAAGIPYIRWPEDVVQVIHIEELLEIPDEQLDLAQVLMKRSRLKLIDIEKN